MAACQSNTTPKVDEISFPEALEPKKSSKYGFDLDLYKVVKKKILSGDTFSSILENHGINYPEVYNILQVIKRDVDVKRLVTGKPYQLLYTKDSVPTLKAFIYENDVRSYKVIQLRDSIYGIQINKPIKLILRKGTGLIENSLYETMTNSGLNDQLTYYLSDIYAWNIDFYRLQKGDRFKVIYLEKFVDDTISVGIERIKAAFFQHAGKEFYAFDLCEVLFKPTLASEKQFRYTYDDALSYFIGGSIAEDKGFALKPWKKIRFSERKIIIFEENALSMGNYFFQSVDGCDAVKVEYTFGYVKDNDNNLLINLHHSSIPYTN